MQMLTIQAATPDSAQSLYSALSDFQPELVTDDDSKCSVSVELGSDEHVVKVLEAVQRFVESRGAESVKSSVVLGTDARPR